MPALRDLQVRFSAALFDGDIDPVESLIVSDGISGGARLDIYRNNLREGFIKALALGFPVIERLVGAAYFRRLALDFLSAHPSRSGNLHHIGAPLAAFLQQRFEKSEYAYLADVAALEWAHQEALVAVHCEPIAAEAWRDVPPSSYESLQIRLHPACGLVQSKYPIVQIWRANQPTASGEDVVDLGSGGENVLILRAPECIEFHRLPASEFAALAAFSRGENLGSALESALRADTSFDLGAALRRFLTLQIITGLHVPAPATRGSGHEAPAHTH